MGVVPSGTLGHKHRTDGLLTQMGKGVTDLKYFKDLKTSQLNPVVSRVKCFEDGVSNYKRHFGHVC